MFNNNLFVNNLSEGEFMIKKDFCKWNDYEVKTLFKFVEIKKRINFVTEKCDT